LPLELAELTVGERDLDFVAIEPADFAVAVFPVVSGF
jgi:hypothetical protein